MILPDEHFLAPPQVTAMDEQSGTHRVLHRVLTSCCSPCLFCRPGVLVDVPPNVSCHGHPGVLLGTTISDMTGRCRPEARPGNYALAC